MMSHNNEILAIDDDNSFLFTLKTYFGDHRITVSTISDAVMSSAVNFGLYKVVLLDLKMPGISGEEVLSSIMLENRRPTVIIVSSQCDLETRIKLLERGADFFMSKPVDLRELLLICKRRMGGGISQYESTTHWSISKLKYTLCTPTGTVHGLTTSEFLILKHLFEACPDVVPKEKLVRAISNREGDDMFLTFRSLEVMISRMRGRFSTSDASFPIKALRNVGYVFHGHGKLTD